MNFIFLKQSGHDELPKHTSILFVRVLLHQSAVAIYRVTPLRLICVLRYGDGRG